MASEAGKGSKPRPFSVTQEQYDNRWDAIFGRDTEEKVLDNDQDTKYNTETEVK